MSKMPSLFIGHGTPMNTLHHNKYTEAWRQLGQKLPRPRALLVVSAHWCLTETAVTAMASPRTIHDFYGFPQELFDFDYPAEGDPVLAQKIIELARPVPVAPDYDQWGLDHGTWSVLAHMYPEADIPVVQLSIHAQQTLEYHLELAARLAPLREKGVMILGSGNVVHNLRAMQRQAAGQGYDWAERFDEAVVQQMMTAPGEFVNVLRHPDYANAVPSPDHLIPLIYIAGVAAAENATLEVLTRGCTMGSISMTSFGLGATGYL